MFQEDIAAECGEHEQRQWISVEAHPHVDKDDSGNKSTGIVRGVNVYLTGKAAQKNQYNVDLNTTISKVT